MPNAPPALFNALGKSLLRHKYRVLLGLIVAALVTQPFARGSTVGSITHELLTALSAAALIFVFDRPWERWTSLGLGSLAMLVRWGSLLASQPLYPEWLAAFHAATALFMAFAIANILRSLFTQRVVLADHLVGVFCGYLLAGIAWSNLYIMVENLTPDHAFRVAENLSWQIDDFESRRSLFNYFSFTTLTTVGFGDVSPVHPLACTLAWLEAAFGQFYVAVLVAQLVGLKLAEPRYVEPH